MEKSVAPPTNVEILARVYPLAEQMDVSPFELPQMERAELLGNYQVDPAGINRGLWRLAAIIANGRKKNQEAMKKIKGE